MNTILFICIVGALIALAAYFVLPALARNARIRGMICAVNVGASTVGTHGGGKLTRFADEAVPTRYLLLKKGTDANHVALCDAADRPLGIASDEAEEAEDPINVETFGAACETKIGIASEAIAVDVELFTADDGKLQNKPTVAGTYWRVGRSLTATSGANQEIGLDPCEPELFVVIAALESTNGTAGAAADLAALKAETEKLSDDFRRLITALGGRVEIAA